MDKNMDIKDLFKNIKLGGGKKDARKGGQLNAFFEKNPQMKYILPAVAVLISLVVMIMVIVLNNPNTDIPEPVSVQGQEVAVLPQLERGEPETIADGADPFEEDVLANARVTGMIYNFGGYWTATIATKDNKNGFTVQVGDYVGSSDWYVESIDGDTVTVTMGEKTRTISK